MEDENGNIACDTRKIMMSLSSIYKIMRGTLTYLCHEGNMINSRGLGYIHVKNVSFRFLLESVLPLFLAAYQFHLAYNRKS